MLYVHQTFVTQVSTDSLLTELFYIFTTMGAFLALLALSLLDGAMVHPKNLVDTFVQKMINAFVGGMAFLIAGYGIWNWQFDQASGIPKALQHSLSNWWILGTYMRTFGQNIDPAVLPGADTQQIFVVFFFTFAALLGAFIHSMGLERLKPCACYIMSAIVGGILMPVMAYLTWGPAGPLTNQGLHDFVGCFAVYMFLGIWSLILSWRLGPRVQAGGVNGMLLGAGAVLLMVAIPIFAIGCGFFQPGVGYYGISNTSSGLGIVFANVFVAFGGGALAGALIAYRKHNPVYVLLGPIAGYIACTAVLDIAAPWECIILSITGPFIMLWAGTACIKLKIHDYKIVPLALGPSILSALAAGVIGSGLPAGGVAGLTGNYAFQHAHISLEMQVIGIAVTLTITAITGLATILTIEKTIGLRVSLEEEHKGLDDVYWNPHAISMSEFDQTVEIELAVAQQA